MKKYQYYIQRIVQLPEILRFKVTAQNKEQADKIASKINDENNDSIKVTGQDYLWDSSEITEVEIYDEDNNSILKEYGN